MAVSKSINPYRGYRWLIYLRCKHPTIGLLQFIGVSEPYNRIECFLCLEQYRIVLLYFCGDKNTIFKMNSC